MKNFTEFPISFSTPNSLLHNKYPTITPKIISSNTNKFDKNRYCKEIITHNLQNQTIFSSNLTEDYGIPLSIQNNDFSNVKEEYFYTSKKPQVCEFEDLSSLSESSKSMALVAREVSLLTSFNSSNTCKKHLEYEQYQQLILSTNKISNSEESEEIIGMYL